MHGNTVGGGASGWGIVITCLRRFAAGLQGLRFAVPSRCALGRHLGAIRAREFQAFGLRMYTRPAGWSFILPTRLSVSAMRAPIAEMLEAWFGRRPAGRSITAPAGHQADRRRRGPCPVAVSYGEADRGGQPYHADRYPVLPISGGVKATAGFWIHDQGHRRHGARDQAKSCASQNNQRQGASAMNRLLILLVALLLPLCPGLPKNRTGSCCAAAFGGTTAQCHRPLGGGTDRIPQ